jgi:CDP-diacylglycerol--serine O-phosphatidyltransferase
VSREWVLPLFVVAVAMVLLLIFYPWETLTAIVIAYLAAIPLGVRRYRRLKREHEASAPPGGVSTDDPGGQAQPG